MQNNCAEIGTNVSGINIAASRKANCRVKIVDVAAGFPLESGSDCDHCAGALSVRENGGNKDSIILPESAGMKPLEERARPRHPFVARNGEVV